MNPGKHVLTSLRHIKLDVVPAAFRGALAGVGALRAVPIVSMVDVVASQAHRMLSRESRRLGRDLEAFMLPGHGPPEAQSAEQQQLQLFKLLGDQCAGSDGAEPLRAPWENAWFPVRLFCKADARSSCKTADTAEDSVAHEAIHQRSGPMALRRVRSHLECPGVCQVRHVVPAINGSLANKRVSKRAA